MNAVGTALRPASRAPLLPGDDALKLCLGCGLYLSCADLSASDLRRIAATVTAVLVSVVVVAAAAAGSEGPGLARPPPVPASTPTAATVSRVPLCARSTALELLGCARLKRARRRHA